MDEIQDRHDSNRTDLVILALLGLVHFLLHIFTNGNYGMFRDEFYYIACANHLDWGYVDHPPLSIAILAGWKAIFGDSVHSIRILPALVGAGLVYLTGVIAGELGGKRYAKIVAGLCVFISGVVLVNTGFYSMNAFELLFWSLGFYLLIRIIKTGDMRLWIWLGLVMGLGFMNKISMLVFGFSLLLGLLLTSHRHQFRSRYLWIGGLIAVVIFVPHVIWQILNGWPTREFMENAQRGKIVAFSPFEFFLGQIFDTNPINFPIWMIGLVSLLLAKSVRQFRILGLMYLITYLVFTVQRSKVYYLSPLYPVLLAAGMVAIGAFFERRGLGWAKVLLVILLVSGGLFVLPFTIPVLPVEEFVAYQEKVGMGPPQEETNVLGMLPQYYADRFGWVELVERVAYVHGHLTPEEKADCGIFTGNYGEAGAIDYYGPEYGLPKAISGHNNYYLWGPGNITGNVMIVVGDSREGLEQVFEVVTLGATVRSMYSMPYENNLPIWFCLKMKEPLEIVWFDAKHFE
jgi:hypothetical protein